MTTFIKSNALPRHGHFWLADDASLHYLTPNLEDIMVRQISVGYNCSGKFIARINGDVVPAPALAQLRLLIANSDYYSYRNLYNKLTKYQREISA